jgi:hypothetical protein
VASKLDLSQHNIAPLGETDATRCEEVYMRYHGGGKELASRKTEKPSRVAFDLNWYKINYFVSLKGEL